jgi:hypothetical protein
MPDMPPRRRQELLPVIGLAVVLAVLVAGYLLFPRLHRALSYQDCIASGRITGC